MAPTSRAHGIIQGSIVALINSHLHQRPGSNVLAVNPGIIPAFQAEWNFFIPDAAVTCSETDTDPVALHHPSLVIEILPSLSHGNTWRNVRAYMHISSVKDILIVHSTSHRIELLRRGEDGKWPDSPAITTEGVFRLASIELDIALESLYTNSGIR